MGTKIKSRNGQTAVEYILLLMAVVAIVLIGFQKYLPGLQETSNTYYNRAAPGILGPPARCGDGICQPYPFENCCRCPPDCGNCAAAMGC